MKWRNSKERELLKVENPETPTTTQQDSGDTGKGEAYKSSDTKISTNNNTIDCLPVNDSLDDQIVDSGESYADATDHIAGDDDIIASGSCLSDSEDELEVE